MSRLVSRRHMLQFATATGAACLLQPTGCLGDQSHVAWLGEIQRPPSPPPGPLERLTDLLQDEHGHPITSLAGWQDRRITLINAWQQFLGSLGLDLRRSPELKTLSEDRIDGVIRRRVEYEIEPGILTEAYILLPAALDQPARDKLVPGVAVFHSTVNHSILQPAGLGPDREKAFGWQLAQRGYAAICPRNFLWPDNERIVANEETSRFQQRHPGVTGMAKMLHDAIIATNILATLPGIDAKRLGAVGHSLGAKEVLYLAAFDDRIRATVSSEGGIGTRFSNWDAPWYLGPAIKEPGFTRQHHELLALVAPRAFLLVGGESADGDRGWPYIDAALPVYRLYGGTPRVGQYNHRGGHAVPPECEQRIYEWLETYL